MVQCDKAVLGRLARWQILCKPATQKQDAEKLLRLTREALRQETRPQPSKR